MIFPLATTTKAEAVWYYYVCTEATPLNVRSGPGINYPIIGSVPKGYGIHIDVSYRGGEWAPVQRYNLKGFAKVDYICQN